MVKFKKVSSHFSFLVPFTSDLCFCIHNLRRETEWKTKSHIQSDREWKPILEWVKGEEREWCFFHFSASWFQQLKISQRHHHFMNAIQNHTAFGKKWENEKAKCHWGIRAWMKVHPINKLYVHWNKTTKHTKNFAFDNNIYFAILYVSVQKSHAFDLNECHCLIYPTPQTHTHTRMFNVLRCRHCICHCYELFLFYILVFFFVFCLFIWIRSHRRNRFFSSQFVCVYVLANEISSCFVEM